MNNKLIAQGLLTNPIAPNLSPFSEGEGFSLLSGIVVTVIRSLIIVAIIAFIFLFILGAIKWILSGGDKAKLESARGTLTHALIGLIIVLSFFAIAKVIEIIFGVCILNIDLGVLKIGSQDIGGVCGRTPDLIVPQSPNDTF